MTEGTNAGSRSGRLVAVPSLFGSREREDSSCLRWAAGRADRLVEPVHPDAVVNRRVPAEPVRKHRLADTDSRPMPDVQA